MAIHPFDYAGIRVWGVSNGSDSWRELQKRAAKEGAPLDALFLNAQEQWIAASDLPREHPIHWALEQDRERRRRGFGVSSGRLMSRGRLRERARGMSGPVQSKVTSVLRLPAGVWCILHDCGHRRTVTRDDLEREQLFIGKLVVCAECAKKF